MSAIVQPKQEDATEKKKKKRKTGFTQWRALFVVFCFTVARRLAIAMLLTLVPTGTPQGNAKKGKFEKFDFEYLHFLLLYTSTTPYFGSKHCIFAGYIAGYVLHWCKSNRFF